MRKLYHLLLLSAVALCMLGASAKTAFAQTTTVEITEGREFYFGIPHCKRPTGEGARGVPIQLWVGSKIDNTVTVEAPALGFAQTHKIKAGTVKIISIPEGLMNTESEIRRSYGIHVSAVDPVTVTCYLSYKVSGEAFAVPSVETAGKKYFIASMWQDQTNEYKPGQILIVATKDNTKVTYTPTVDTERIKAKKIGSVTLQKGDTYLIQSKVQPAYNQDPMTDLTGSYIESNKPIVVFSGHTKGAYPPFSSTMLGIPANFMRNMYLDHMHAVEFLGTEYVIAPIQYTNRPYNNADIPGEGDLIRFVASQDGTDMFVSRNDGTAPKLLKSGMKRGDYYEVITFKDAAVYTSSKPVLAVQYGKSWRVSVVPPIIDPSGGDGSSASRKKEQIANPPRNGEGMMFALTPESQWSSHAIFRSPEGMNNFVNITFRTIHTDSLKFNKKYFRAVFGSKVHEIPGTPYSYVAAINASGEHQIEADSGSGAKFAAYVYGNLDGTKDGFAYGYPVGVNYALNLPPALIEITDNMICGNVTGKVEIIHQTPDFAGLFDIRLDKTLSSNYTLSTVPSPIETGSDKAEFALTLIDPTKDAHGVVYVIDQTGQQITRTYDYIAEKVEANPTSVKFGPLAIGAEECKQITLTNPTKADVVLNGLELKDNRVEFTIKNPTTFPVTIPAGGSITIDVCGKALAAGEVKDSVRALLTCYNPMIAELKLVAGQPKVTMTDWNFGDVPVNIEKSKQIVIENISEGDIQVELYSVAWQDKTHYRTEGLENDKFPIILPKRGDTYTFTVYYKPDQVGVQNDDVALFQCNTTIDKTNSIWQGRGIDAGPYITGNDWLKRRINRGPYPFDQGSFGIAGNTGFKVERLELDGAAQDVAAFTVDIDRFNKDYAGKTLPGGFEVKDFKYTFSPTEERAYSVKIKLHGTAPNGEAKVAEAELRGIGIETHGKGDVLDFGSHLVSTTPIPGVIEAFCTATENVPMELKFNPADPLKGADEAYFSIDPSFDLTQTYLVQPGTSLEIPVLFTPSVKQASFNAEINVTEDAPEEVRLLLMASSFTEGTPGATAKGDEFNPIYIYTNSDDGVYSPKQYGKVTVKNTGTIDATITGWSIDQSKDYVNFTEPIVKALPLAAGETTVIDNFTFVNPTTERNNYEATVNITVKFNNEQEETLQATLLAKAKDLPIEVSIPKGYRVDAGKYQVIDYNIRNLDANEPLTNALMNKFHAFIDYDQAVIRPEFKGSRDLKDAILLNGLLESSKGWTVANAELISLPDGKERLSLELRNDGSNPVVLGGTATQTLFRISVRGYLATDKNTDLDCEILPVERQFVIPSDVPGDLAINEFCVDDTRAIKKRAGFALNSIAPNPVKDRTEITYSVAFDAPTRLVVVNSLGEEVAVLVDGVQEPGIYTVPFDATTLAAGVYFYRITAGPYSETKTMNVVK